MEYPKSSWGALGMGGCSVVFWRLDLQHHCMAPESGAGCCSASSDDLLDGLTQSQPCEHLHCGQNALLWC